MLERIKEELVNAANKIKANILAAGAVASKSLYNSVAWFVQDNKVGVELNAYAEFIQHGRKPTTNSGDSEVLRAIQRWTKLKGIPESAAYPIAKKIHEQGYEPKGEIFEKVFDELKEKIPTLAAEYGTKIAYTRLINKFRTGLN
ncbi:MAG: hypothetical protein KatS3mg087_1884 [Patescibacteria group bacterium]|nr:MAG: hypothetical protein KatS3mg087_1884 [Patescibacteria group bacterium]